MKNSDQLIIPSQGVKDFMASLTEKGLVPLEITPDDLIQRVTITHNAAAGQFDWKAEKIGEQAIGLLADVMRDMWVYFFKQPLRPRLASGHAKVCLDLNGDTLSMSFGLVDPAHPDLPPIADPLVAKAMLSAALFFLSEKTAGGNFNPLEALLGNIKFTSKGDE